MEGVLRQVAEAVTAQKGELEKAEGQAAAAQASMCNPYHINHINHINHISYQTLGISAARLGINACVDVASPLLEFEA